MANGENVLIEFDATVDTDIGVIKVLKEKYGNPKFVREEVLSIDSDEALIEMLLYRSQPNPLTVCLKDDYLDQADSLYNQIIENEYDKILEYSNYTAIAKIVSMFIKAPNNSIKCTVVCKNEKQKHFIKRYDEDIEVIIGDYDKDLAPYTSIFIKHYIGILNYKNVEGKNIYVSRIVCNMDVMMGEYIPKIAISTLVGYVNRITLIDVYPNKIAAGTDAEEGSLG